MKFLLIALFSFNLAAQIIPDENFDIESSDLKIGGDIFSDFNEDIESSKVLEDERFYKYGRFFSFLVGIGNTNFDGNRGRAYNNDNPSFALAVQYFLNFRVSFNLGIEFSRHQFVINGQTEGYDTAPGLIQVNMLRPYFAFRYYIDTADLGTALTFANPYFTGRLEYWYQTNNFIDNESIPKESGGGLGFGVGGGLEFPITLKEYYFNLEFLYHKVNLFDKFTQNYRVPDTVSTDTGADPVAETYDDLAGDIYTVFVSFVISW